jgi:hypothetical protein
VGQCCDHRLKESGGYDTDVVWEIGMHVLGILAGSRYNTYQAVGFCTDVPRGRHMHHLLDSSKMAAKAKHPFPLTLRRIITLIFGKFYCISVIPIVTVA